MRSYISSGLIGLLLVGLISSFGPLVPDAKVQDSVPVLKDVRVGYVDLERVLRRYQPYLEAQREMLDYEKQLREDLQSQEQDLQEMRKNLEQGAEMMNQEQLQQRQQEFQQKAQQFRRQARESDQKLQEKENELLEPIMMDLQEAIKNIGQNNDYDVIERYDRRSDSPVLWVNSRVDVTGTLIDYLEEQDQVVEDPSEVEALEEETGDLDVLENGNE